MDKKVTHIHIPGDELLIGLHDCSKYLYHYTSTATFLSKILPSKTLRLSPYTETNDPKESKAWRFNSNIQDSEKYDFADWPVDELNSKMNEGLKSRTNVVCFSCDGQLTGNHLSDIHNRGWCKPRMWAQYADRHEGVCLVFDRKSIESAVRSTFGKNRPVAYGQVTYRNRALLDPWNDPTYVVLIDELAKRGWEDYIRFHLRHSHPRLFFEKNEDWMMEREYRIVVWGGSGHAEYVNFGESLRGVMLGASVCDQSIKDVYAAVHDLKILVQQLVWQGCCPWYAIDKAFSWEIRYREENRAKGQGQVL